MDGSACVVNVTSEEALSELYTQFSIVFVVIIVPLITFVGLISNGVFLFIIYRIQEMRTSTNFYLAHLAVADSFLLINSASQWIISYSNSPVDSISFATSIGCALPNFMIYMCYFASVSLITLVIMERYVAICHPMRWYRSIADGYSSITVAIIIWVLSFVGAVFSLKFSKAFKVCISGTQHGTIPTNLPAAVWFCDNDPDWCYGNLCDKVISLADLIQFCVCLSVVSFMSISISFTLIHGEYKMRQRSVRSMNTTRARFHLARMVMINALVFFVCLTPWQIITVNKVFRLFTNSDLFNFSKSFQKNLKWLSRVTMIINSAINPIIYSLVNPRYREAICEAFRIRRHQWRTRGCKRPGGKTYSSQIDHEMTLKGNHVTNNVHITVTLCPVEHQQDDKL